MKPNIGCWFEHVLTQTIQWNIKRKILKEKHYTSLVEYSKGDWIINIGHGKHMYVKDIYKIVSVHPKNNDDDSELNIP
jgi:hypothetical protein